VCNDISARGLFFRDEPPTPPFKFDWFSHKALDASLPIGPGIVPAWAIDDSSNLAIRLTVNGVIKQDSSTADMWYTIPKLIAAASRVMTLEPGDILATGTPGGVGAARQEFLRPGDEVVVEIDQVGRLINRIAADTGWE
jgi:2-keto-4-pentenoate hydratase/2-oxohepta-3-ene-1,7-dioic acid hydratase in catechol pathway